jgi:hypothetical protein
MMIYDDDVRYRDELDWAATQGIGGKQWEKAVAIIGAGANLCGRRV